MYLHLGDNYDTYFFFYLQDFKTFARDTCQITYMAKSPLLQHQRMDHDTQQFACGHCVKTFRRADNQKRHERLCQPRNHGTVQFACGRCHKRFSLEDNKRRYERTFHGATGHVCPECKKRYATAQGLRRNIEWHNKPEKAASKECDTVKPVKQTSTRYRCRRCSDV